MLAQRLSAPDPTPCGTAEQVRRLTVDLLATRFPLGVNGYRYTDPDIYDVLVAAAAQRRSLESAAQQLSRAPSANLVRHYLADRLFEECDVDSLEAELNVALVERLPPGLTDRPLCIAIDFTLLPYYGPTGREPDQLRRGEAKAGTTWFHCYATAFVLHAGKRVTLALTFVRADEARRDVLDDLLGRLRRLGVTLDRLYLDREFASVAVLRLLSEQPFVSIVALPKRGRRLQALLTGRRGYRTTYTMESDEAGDLTFPLWVAVCSAAGRRGRHGREYLPFAVVGAAESRIPVNRIASAYRRRFGIEAGYRQMNAVRARTTSRHPGFRLLLVGIALLLTNLWVWLKAHLLAQTARRERPAARTWLDTALRLDRFCDLLLEALIARYGSHNSLAYPFTLSMPLKL